MSDGKMIPVRYGSKGQVTGYEYVEPEVIQVPVPYNQQPIVAPVPDNKRSQALVTGSYEDRAKGFNIKTAPLSVLVGIFLVVAAWVLGDSIAFAGLALAFFVGFVGVWLLSFIVDTFSSAEGVALFESWRLWNFLDREQSERHMHYRPSAAGDHRLNIWLRFVIVVSLAAAGVYLTALVLEMVGG